MILSKLEQILQAVNTPSQAPVAPAAPAVDAGQESEYAKNIGGAQGSVTPQGVIGSLTQSDHNRTPVGVPGKSPASSENFLSVKSELKEDLARAVEEIKKSLKSSETPINVDVSKAQPSAPKRVLKDAAWKISQGEAKLSDYVNNSVVTKLERELAMQKEWASISGGAL